MIETVEVDKHYLENLECGYKQRGYEIEELKRQIEKLEDEKRSADFRIEHELEPRIAQEKRSYDSWVLQPSGEIECSTYYEKVDDLADYVTDEHNRVYLEEGQDNSQGLYEMILYLIFNSEDVDNGVYKIVDKE